ncbi:MAG: EAL domain-containing protein [Sulfuritalea sp.]|nr:EAL domain-containing protein [Sulfuritalea sp.]
MTSFYPARIFRLILCLGAFCCIGTAEARDVRVGIYSNEPKIFTDAAGKPAGILIDILNSIASKENWTLRYVHCEWQQCLDELQAGQIDLMPDVAYTDARDRIFAFHQTPALFSWSQIFSRKGAGIASVFDLEGKRIAVLDGSVQEESFSGMVDGFGIKVHILPVATFGQAFDLVASGQADAAISNNRFGEFHAQDYQMVETPVVFRPARLFYATVEGRNADLLAAIDRHLDAWKADPDSEYYQILKKWRGASPEAFIPTYIWQVVGVLAALLVLMTVIVSILRRQVKLKLSHLQEEKSKVQAILDALPDLLFEVGMDGRIHAYHSHRSDPLAVPAKVFLGKTAAEVLPADAAATCMAAINEARENGMSMGRQFELDTRNGIRSFELSVSEKSVAAGQDPRFILLARDITERKQAVTALQKSEQRFLALSTMSSDWFWTQDEQFRFTEFSGAFASAFRPPTNSIGKTRWELPIDLTPEQWAEHRAILDAHLPFRNLEYAITGSDGERRWYTVNGEPLFDGTGAFMGYHGTGSDITARKQAEDKINELAFFDQLTGLPNRTLLLDRLKQAIIASTRSGSHGALLIIDLDNFKTLNDTRGHDVGDMLLKQVAKRLEQGVREGDTVARLGGDEFVVLLTGLSSDEADAATAAEVIAEKSLAALNQTYTLGETLHHSTASIGVTLFKGGVANSEELLKQADLAMYKSKTAGRNTVRFFDPTLESTVMEHAALEHDLRQAMADGQYLLHYQAQVAGGQLTGVEVLVRWQHPQRGLVAPAEFIPLAEETGLILPLGRWVLETACTQLAAWAARPEMRHLTVAVNVSAHQFRQADFVDEVLAVLKNTGANPQRLKLELTESLLVANVEDVIEKMFALKAKGVGFSLDDFGTGYSSLSYLKRLPLDQLKIDQSFVRDVLNDPNDASIVRTIIALAQNLGLGVIAEGVETEAQRDFLANSGCLAYQGYLFSRPLPLDEFEAFARRG